MCNEIWITLICLKRKRRLHDNENEIGCVESLTMTMLWSNLRDGNPITRHKLNFDIPLSQSTFTNLLFSAKTIRRALVLAMREQKMSYREIGKALDLHWTRVHQIIKSKQ